MRRNMLIAAGCSLLVLSTGTAAAGPYTPDPETQVSGTSPFDPGCGLTPNGGTLFVNSEVEPWVDVSPVDSDIVAGIWQQDRWSNGGSRGNVAAISFDAGGSWDLLTFPGVTECTGGDFDRASDPWLSFSPNGDLHVMHLVLDIASPPGRPGGFGDNGMMMQKIPAAAFGDGVVEESEVTDPILIAFDDKGNLHDKNSMTADPFDSDFAYAVWDFLDIPTGALINPDRGVFGGGLGFKGAALFSRTTDGGQTWSEPEVLYNPGGVNQTIGNQIVVDDQGVLFDFFNEILNFRNDDRGSQFDFNLSLKFSPDRGETWLPHGRPIRAQEIQSLGVQIPAGDDNAGAPVRAAAVLFDVAVDPANGNLYAVWQDGRFSGFAHDSVAFTMSTDAGATWSTPIQVNQTPDTVPVDNRQAHTPQVHVADDGTVGVSYYDFRNNAAGGGTDTDLWLAHCHSACSDPSSWTDESHVAGSFDIQQAPFAGGFFLGDYVGLDNMGDAFTPFFTQTTAIDPANQYYTTVSP
ncbi:MAG TPA: sialidase family protein [Jiangellaceae bacterium]